MITDKRNPEWDVKEEKWIYAWDNYTGEYIDTGKITNYLHQRLQREGQKAYESRRKDPDPVMHLATAVDGINGIIASKHDEKKEEWGVLGDPETEGTIAYSIKRNADGSGMNWNPLMKSVGIKQTVMHTVWGLVDGIEKDEDGRVLSDASVKVILPQHVVDWYPKTGNPTQVLVKEEREIRESMHDDPEMREVYTLYELDGWRRYIVQEKKTESGGVEHVEVEIGNGEYEYYDSSDKQTRILPIFRVELPLPRFIGYLLARKQNHIFNFKSVRDFGASNLSLALLKLKCESEHFDSIVDNLTSGSNIIREDPDIQGEGHKFMSPDSTHLAATAEILEKDIEDFYHTAFKEYGDSARQVTATEIVMKSSTGIEAFLSLLVSTIDEFENNCFLRLEQVYFPNRPESWGQAYAERSIDFQPKDVDEAFRKIAGGLRDAEQAGAMSTLEKVKTLHPEWGEDEIKEEVDRINQERGALPISDNMIGG